MTKCKFCISAVHVVLFLIKIHYLFPINTFSISMLNIKFTDENTNITLDPERTILSFVLINVLVIMSIIHI